MSIEGEVRARTRQRAVKLDAPEKHGHEGSILVTRTVYGTETEVQNDKISVPLFTMDPARVSVAGGVTRNTGDYNSARVDVRIELPCYPEASEIERVYNIASEMVDRFVRNETYYATGKREG
jgi:hypothetical protein